MLPHTQWRRRWGEERRVLETSVGRFQIQHYVTGRDEKNPIISPMEHGTYMCYHGYPSTCMIPRGVLCKALRKGEEG
ncbi:hypothetical protein PISMIDRAFT_683340 [Pisolithus microcarpus 441]|uniref:Unplaced genomic scaffold scaffold_110, whole genome shotgun sequence n=1 Tax=Pisolithus microcarpus 441 TaxID=765257 RepID=A0A0C9ZH94_9AGAM|nr:hypothetical protein PISMIDRAFT_683612 [Pisolithus microcarpus 441]KIK19353.1 hypothetical protein PISMIDRAFT_683340 [Pisolithus microcarpus 441]